MLERTAFTLMRQMRLSLRRRDRERPGTAFPPPAVACRQVVRRHSGSKAEAAQADAGSQRVAPEVIRPGVGACTHALRALTRRNCLSEESEANGVSFSTRRQDGSLEGSRAKGPTDARARSGLSGLGFAAQTQRPSPAQAESAVKTTNNLMTQTASP